MTDFRFQTPQPVLTRAEIAANVAALPMPDGWTLQDDVALWEGLFMGLGFEDIAVKRGGKADQWRARFFALRRAAVGDGVLTLDAQKALLAIVRKRANQTQSNPEKE